MGKSIVDKNKNFRHFCGVTYLSFDVFLTFCTTHDHVKNFAFILHDQDTFLEDDENHKKGDKKQPHIHFIIKLDIPLRLQTFQNFFGGYYTAKGEQINTFCQPCKDVYLMYRYFTHADNPEKFQYDSSTIVGGDLSEFEMQVATEDSVFICLDLMLNGVSRREIARQFGRDFIYHYGHIRDLYNDIIQEESKKI